jgi:heme-degrading monooxygenase HmoA
LIIRIWRTQIDEARADAYREFAYATSLPMFRAQPGFAGVFFAARGDERAVITLWRDSAAVLALHRSESYRATVAEIEATGFLAQRGVVEVLDNEELHLEPGAFDPDSASA